MSVQSVGPIPAELPAPLVNPHEFARFDVAETTAMEHGDLRRRVRFTSVAQRAGVQWMLTQAQFDTFWDWHEATLDAGAQPFDVRVAAQGEAGKVRSFAPAWYVAQFGSPWQAEVINSGGPTRLLYRVAAELVLWGAGTAARVPADIAASGTVQVTGYAAFAAPSFAARGDVDNTGGAYFDFAAVETSAGAVYVTGRMPRLLLSIRVALGAVTVAGQAPKVGRGVVMPAAGLTLSGQTPTVGRGVVTPAAGLALSGQAPTVL